MSHSIPVRIYYEDTDAGGVCYHGSYLNFGERGRTEYLRHLGHTNSEISQTHNMIFVVRHIDINYLKPCFLDDLCELTTRVSDIKNSSFVMQQTLKRSDDVINDMRVSLVCVDNENYKPVRMPDVIRDEFIKEG